MTPDQIAAARTMAAGGASNRAIARVFLIDCRTLKRYVPELDHGKPKPKKPTTYAEPLLGATFDDGVFRQVAVLPGYHDNAWLADDEVTA